MYSTGLQNTHHNAATVLWLDNWHEMFEVKLEAI